MSNLKIACTVLISLLVIIAIPIAVLLLAPMTYAGLVERALRSATGLAVDINALEVDLFPPRIATDNLQVRNPQLDAGEPLLTLEKFSAAVSPRDWWQDSPAWWNAAATGIVVRAAQDADGRSYWDIATDDGQTSDSRDAAPPEKKQQAEGASPLFSFNTITINDLDFFRVLDGETHHLQVSTLALRKEQDERLNVELKAKYRDQPLSARGTLALPSSDRARDVDFKASLFGNEIRMLGRVGHDGLTPGEAHISAKLKDLSIVGQLLDQDFGRFTPVILDARLNAPQPGRWEISAEGDLGANKFALASAASVDGEAYLLDKLTLDFADSSLAASGTVDRAAKSIKLDLDAKRVDVDQLLAVTASATESEKATQQTQEVAPASAGIDPSWLAAWSVAIDATLTRLDYQPYRMDDLTLHVTDRNGALYVDGTLNGLTMRSNNATDNVASEDTGAAVAAGSDAESGADNIALRLVKPLAFNASLTLARETGVGGRPLTAQLGTNGVKARLSTALPAGGDAWSQGNISANIDNLDFIKGVDTQRWDTFLPFTLAVEAQSSQSTVLLKPINVGVSGNDVDGELSIDLSQPLPHITGALHSSLLDLNQFSTTAAIDVEDQAEAIAADSGDVIGDKPIDWSWLNAASADLSVTLDKFNFNQASMRNVETEIRLQAGELNVDPIKANLSKGGIRGDLHIKQKDKGATLNINVIATGLSPADLGKKNAGLIDGGETDVLINLQTSGTSPQQLAAELNGEIALELQRATIRNSLFEVIGSDILTETIALINPFAKQDDRTELECAAVYFKAEQGVLTSPDQLVIETSKMKIRGGGEIDLGKETLLIDFVPTPRQGLGISLSSLSSLVRLGGTLGNPQPIADPKGILKAGATIGAAVATGGLSLLGQGLFDRMRSAGTACGKIFEQVPDTDIPAAIDPARADKSVAL